MFPVVLALYGLVLRNLPWEILLLYLGAITAMGSTSEKRLQRLDKVFNHLERAGFNSAHMTGSCSKQKSHCVVSADGHDQEKVKAVKNWCTPKTSLTQDLFLNVCSYYQYLIPLFAACAHPLSEMLESGQHFEWTDEFQAAFDDLKSALTSEIIVGFFER